MRAYRLSVLSIAIFAVAYPVVSGSVLVARWGSPINEVYPISPWTLFCFVPNQEVDFAVRLCAVDGQVQNSRPFFDELAELDEHKKLISYAIVQEWGRLITKHAAPESEIQRRLFEETFLRPLAGNVRYELVRRRFDVLNRWKTGQCDEIQGIVEFVYVAPARK